MGQLFNRDHDEYQECRSYLKVHLNVNWISEGRNRRKKTKKLKTNGK